MRRSDEGQGVLILGDIGTGKSQIIQQFLQQMAGREGEAAIVYDPAREFVKSHYRPERGDVILNPLDNRSPFWSPILERKYRTDYQLLADAFFPGRNAERIQKAGAFFLNASREIFARMLEFEPTPAQLVEWLADEKEIDRMCVGTELANYIPPNAFNQRGGVLGSIATLAKTMRLLPSREECDFDFSLTEWAHERRGWLFLTATKETEERLRPLYAAHLDLLMRRLMSIDDAWGRQHPVKLIMDGVHSLPSLPTFEKVLMEGRKFGVDTILATQNKHQIDDLYGRDAALTMLSSPRYKVVLRSSEPDSAKWLSRLLGDEELERSRATAAAYTGHRPLVSREEISNLTDLAGYLKYDGMVVPFRFDFMAQQEVAAGFVPRQSLGSDKNLESAVQPEGGLWSLSGLEGMIKHWDKN
jgi:type IV secretory pathway TraG/TraD family ATPase VirD4